MTLRELATALVLAVIALCGAFALSRAQMKSGWLRRLLQMLGLLTEGFAVCATATWIGMRGSRMPAPVYAIESPTGQYVVKVIEPDGDPIPTRFVRIYVRRTGHFFAKQVFAGPQEPNIRWTGDETLELTYPAEAGGSSVCDPISSGLTVVCNSVPRAGFKPNLRE